MSSNAKILSKQVQIGLLGGGQLARMLALAAHPMGLKPLIFSEKKDDPAAQVSSYWFDSKSISLKDFCEQADVISFESEFVDCEALEKLPAHLQAKMSPSLSLMKQLQVRSEQKNLLVKNKVPTAPHLIISKKEDLSLAWQKFGPFVLKTSFGGYDGYGTFYARNETELKDLQNNFQPSKHGYIAEKFIPFKRELALIFVRNKKGQIVHLPLVETKQTNSRCDWVLGPVKAKGSDSLIKKLKSFLKKIDYVGCVAFELFDTGKDLLVNEVAPRVHNSGHYSQDALTESQFELHLKAITNQNLKQPTMLAASFVMLNLLGQTSNEIQIPDGLQGKLHMYGKKENRPGRKMGHINYLGKNAKALLQASTKERRRFQL